MSDTGLGGATVSPDLVRLRRFTLGMALLLIALATALVNVERPLSLKPFGISLSVARVNWLVSGIALTVFYGASRFWYYGVLVEESPAYRRKDRLPPKFRWPKGVRIDRGRALGKWLRGLVGTRVLSLTVLKRGTLDEVLEEATRCFPRFGSKRVIFRKSTDPGSDSEEVVIVIPWLCRVGARIQDADYTAPIWFNGLALVVWAWSLVG